MSAEYIFWEAVFTLMHLCPALQQCSTVPEPVGAGAPVLHLPGPMLPGAWIPGTATLNEQRAPRALDN